MTDFNRTPIAIGDEVVYVYHDENGYARLKLGIIEGIDHGWIVIDGLTYTHQSIFKVVSQAELDAANITLVKQTEKIAKLEDQIKTLQRLCNFGK